MLGPVDADRQVLLPKGDNAPAYATQWPLAPRVALEIETDPDAELKCVSCGGIHECLSAAVSPHA
jgi:hypothetical protein